MQIKTFRNESVVDDAIEKEFKEKMYNGLVAK